MMKSFTRWTVTIVLSAAAAGLLTLMAHDSPVRVVFVLWFFLVCPGMMLVRFIHLEEPVLEWALAISLSLAADAFVGGVLLYSGWWSPVDAFAIVFVLTVGGVVVQEVNARRIQGRGPA